MSAVVLDMEDERGNTLEQFNRASRTIERYRLSGANAAREVLHVFDTDERQQAKAKPPPEKLDASVWCARCGMLAPAHGRVDGACSRFVQRDIESEEQQMQQRFVAEVAKKKRKAVS